MTTLNVWSLQDVQGQLNVAQPPAATLDFKESLLLKRGRLGG